MRPTLARTLVPALLLGALPLSSGCVALLGLGAGVVVSQEVLANQTYVAHLDTDADTAWTIAKSSLAHQADGPIDIDEDLRVARGEVDDAKVTVSVEVFDLDRSVLKVSARKYGVVNGEVAQMVMERIVRRLEEHSAKQA